MKRSILLYYVNILILLFSVIVAVTGIIKFPGLLSLLKIDPYSLPQALFTFLHDWIGIALTVFSLLHIILNWKWITGMTKKLIGKQVKIIPIIAIIFTGLGLFFLINNSRNNNLESIQDTESDMTVSAEEKPIEKAQIENTRSIESNKITIENIGSFVFNPEEITAIRDDVFNKGYFSLFDILVYLDESEQINMNYHFSEKHQTHIISDINGLENWWYIAYYDGGWPENNVWRMDLYPYKDNSTITLKQVDKNIIDAINVTFKNDVERTKELKAKVVVPEVVIRGINHDQVFENIEVSAHDLRNDFFLNGTITAIDVILSLSEQGLIEHRLNWYESIGSAGVVKNYFVDEINGEASHDRCGFVYELGEYDFYGFRGNHIHIPSDIRVMNTIPEYVEFFWICI